MNNLASEETSLITHENILHYELNNLYKHAKPHKHSRRHSDPIHTQIYVHNFNRPFALPSIDINKRSLSIFERRAKRADQENYTDLKSKRFQTLPLDMQCKSKFPTQQKRKTFTSREEQSLKKKFIEIDMLTLHTSYAKKDVQKGKEKFQAKQEIKEITSIPTKPLVATFIQNYKMTNEHLDLDNLVRSPYFGVNYKEKEFLYFGEIKKGEFDGKGVMVNRNWVFEGTWMHSKRYQGVQITPKGTYKGNFVHDQRSKVGQFFWNNGEYYSGEWQKNKKHGTGVWKSKNGDVYMGQWTKGKVQGYGSHLTKTGQKYQGYFLNFLKHGVGKQQFPNGDFFEGTFKQGRPHGIGTYKWKNGIVYQGEFRQGFREGKGIIKRGGIQYQGFFEKQKAHGQGKVTVYNGDSFNGRFAKGKKQGKGIYKQSKRIYIGAWHQNRFIQKQE